MPATGCTPNPKAVRVYRARHRRSTCGRKHLLYCAVNMPIPGSYVVCSQRGTLSLHTFVLLRPIGTGQSLKVLVVSISPLGQFDE